MKERIIKRFMSFSMKTKLFILCSGLICFSTALSVVTVYFSVSRTIVDNTRRYTSEIMVQSQHYLEEKMKGLLMKTNYLQLNGDFQRIMRSLWDNDEELYIGDQTKMSELLSQMKAGDDLIDSIYLSAGDYKFYTYDVGQPRIKVFEETELYQEMENKRRIYWGTERPDPIFTRENRVIPVVLPVTIYNIKENNQYIVINLSARALRKELISMEKHINGKLFILNAERDVVLAGSGDEAYEEAMYQLLEAGREENNTYQISSRNLKINGWRICCIQNKKILLRHVDLIRAMMVGIGVLSIIIFSFIAMMISESITRPLKKLQKLMEQGADNGFRQSFEVRYQDEIGHLAQCFNKMCIRIQELMKAVEEEQLKKRKAELRSLNAQINPHFLYNTMDCIYWTSMKKGNQEIADVAINISNIFRLGLNKGKEITTVGNEIRHVVSYLEIQKTIYKGKFDYEISCDSHIKERKIIKLLLQPLAENSIIHGFERMETGGRIWILAKEAENGLLFEVSDNGCGIQEEKMEECMIGESDNGLAVSNIVQRLRLHYGAEASFCYVKEEGKGAVVRIWIKDRKMEE